MNSPNRPLGRLNSSRPLTFSRAMRRLVSLDVWGPSLMTPKVEENLATAYGVLLLVAVWEWFSATLLACFLLGGGRATIGWVPPAAMIGLIWGCAVALLDKTLITMDMDRGVASAGVFARVVIILFASVLTARPVDHWLTRSRVEARLAEEAVLAQAVASLGATERLDAREREIRADDWETREAHREAVLAPLDGALTAATEAFDRASTAEEQAKSALAAAKADLGRRQRSGDASDADINRARAKVGAASARLDEAARARAAANAAVTTAKAQVDRESDRLGDEEVTARTRQADDLGKIETKQAEVQQQLRAPTGISAPADFFEYEAVLHDLRRGATPRWPVAADLAMRERARAAFGIAAPATQDAHPDWTSFWFTFWSVGLSGVFMLIPFLALAFKLVLDPASKRYFSTRAQAEAGQPDAVASIAIERLLGEQ